MAGAFDVFFSYSTRDHAAVERIARALTDAGLRVFLDRWYLTPGQPWPQALEQTLATCNAVAVFIGPEGLGRWQQRERDIALDRQNREPGFPVIPVLLGGGDPALGFLKFNTWVDLSGGAADTEALAILTVAIRREPPGRLARQRSEAARAAVCPYRGLHAFRSEDEPFFFGRDSFAETLTATVLRQPFVAVVGASGSGKSSVVRAGLIPRLRRGAGSQVWDAITLFPTDRPLTSLATALLPALEPDLSEVDRLAEAAKLATHLTDGTVALRDVIMRVLAKQPGTEQLLLFVDQWEELYTLCADDALRQAFVGQLLQAAGQQLRVVSTIRGDFMGCTLNNRDLADRLQDAVVIIGPMTRDELAESIVRPADIIGLTWEAGLPETILDDVGDEPGALPLLEFLLEGLWAARRGGLLTHEAYLRLGRVSGAIAHRAEEVFTHELSEAGREAAKRLFTLKLVHLTDEGRTVRRRARRSECNEDEWTLVELLSNRYWRLLTLTTESGESTAEVAHEALLKKWKRLRQWLNEQFDLLRWHQHFRVAVRSWERTNYDDDALLRGVLMIEAYRFLLADPRQFTDTQTSFIRISHLNSSIMKLSTTSKDSLAYGWGWGVLCGFIAFGSVIIGDRPNNSVRLLTAILVGAVVAGGIGGVVTARTIDKISPTGGRSLTTMVQVTTGWIASLFLAALGVALVAQTIPGIATLIAIPFIVSVIGGGCGGWITGKAIKRAEPMTAVIHIAVGWAKAWILSLPIFLCLVAFTAVLPSIRSRLNDSFQTWFSDRLHMIDPSSPYHILLTLILDLLKWPLSNIDDNIIRGISVFIAIIVTGIVIGTTGHSTMLSSLSLSKEKWKNFLNSY